MNGGAEKDTNEECNFFIHEFNGSTSWNTITPVVSATDGIKPMQRLYVLVAATLHEFILLLDHRETYHMQQRQELREKMCPGHLSIIGPL